ncbi:MAG: sodium/calcium exchanger membrane protein [Herpetosiphonaceae bacterium]|nr:MAG: sodium/calcium exchanger membrane protein [Herpetosiphonaceae bacterium]
MIWLQFVVCATLVVVVGTMLSRYADILAEKTGLGRTWVGAILLAGATSLPELTTGISAVTILGNADLAAGGILGSCLFNLLLLGILDASAGSVPLLQRAEISHILAAGLGGVLLTVVMLGLFVTQVLGLPSLGWVGLPSIAIVAIYFISVRMISHFEKRRVQEVREQEAAIYQYSAIPLWRAVVIFGLLAVAIAGLGMWLATLGEQIAAITGLGTSFVGVIFLAITTSLPEIVASFAALRLNAVDLAVSNIFGSNIFNIFALAIYDLIDLPSMWENLAPIHSFTAVAATLMTSVAIVGLVYRAARRPRWYISWDALTLIALYLGSIYVIYVTTSVAQ